MSPAVASIVCAAVVLALFWLDRADTVAASSALWIPVIWLTLACSRSPHQWLLGQSLMDQLGSGNVDLEGSPIDRFAYSALILLGTIVLIKRGGRVGKLLRANGLILLFLVYCLASLAWSDFADIAIKRWIKAAGDLIMVLVVVSDKNALASIKGFISRAGFVLLPLSVLFIKYYPTMGKSYGQWDYKAVYIGATTNKNTLGAICLLFGLASAWRFLAAWKSKKRAPGRREQLIVHGTVLAMALWLFWMANSMTSLVCFLLACVLLVTTMSRFTARRPAIVHLLVVGLLLISASVLFLGAVPGVLNMIGRDPTLTDRTLIWSVVVNLNPSALFGAGFESFWLGPRLEKIWSVFAWRPFEAHNGYLEIYLNLGWLGILLLATVVASGYAKIIAAFRRRLPASGAMLTFFVVGLIYNFTEAALFRMMAPAWIFLLLAMVSCSSTPPMALTAKWIKSREDEELRLHAVESRSLVSH